MNNLKTSFKLFFKLAFINRSVTVFLSIFLVLGVAMCAISAFAGELTGNKEYLLSITAVTLGICMISVGGMAVSGSANTKFFHSCPDSEKIMTRVMPIWNALLSIAVTILSVILTAISLKIGLVDGNRISDLLLCCTYSCLFCQLASGFFGAPALIIITYLSALPFYGLIFTADLLPSALKHICAHGFGLPLHVAIIIYSVTVTASLIISFKLSEKSYAKRTTKTMITASQLGYGRI